MLSDTMKQVNEAEQNAQQIVQEAKTKAAAIVEAAREQAKQNISEAEAKARADAKDALVQAEKEGAEEKQRYASVIREQLEKETQQALSRQDQAVDVIVKGLV